jgi:hypothetical protein
VQVARFVQLHQRGPRHHQRPEGLQRPDEMAACAASTPEEFVPKGPQAYNERKKQPAGEPTDATDKNYDGPTITVPRCARHRPSPSSAAPCVRSASADRRHQRAARHPEIRGMIARSRTSSGHEEDLDE